MKQGQQLGTCLIGAASVLGTYAQAQPVDKRPNVLVIMADDLGWSDIGAYGSEIRTPNLDALAAQGVKFTNFQVSAYSSPSRATFMTGADPHMVGVGNIAELNTPEQAASANYQGYLKDNARTVAQYLQEAGYYTILSGKWHLGKSGNNTPDKRGFADSFAMLNGEANFFPFQEKEASPDGRDVYLLNGEPVALPANFYATDAYADYLIRHLDQNRNRPFFAFLSFTAPHSPLQAHPQDIAKYDKQYLDGPQALAERRLAKLKRMGLVDRNVTPHPLVNVKNWADLSAEERQGQAKRMQIYAAMIENMDRNIGKVMQSLQQSRRLDNTIVLFLSDNGAAGASREQSAKWGGWIARSRNNSLENMGAGSSYVSTGPDWAQASMAPFALFKGFATEGGVRSPLIVKGPGIARGKVEGRYASMRDLAPTILAWAGAPFTPREGIIPMSGRTLNADLNRPQAAFGGAAEMTAYEIRGGRIVYHGRYKARYLSKERMGISPEKLPVGRWALFDLATDPGETRDLSAEQPQRLQVMIAAYRRYAAENGVVEISAAE